MSKRSEIERLTAANKVLGDILDQHHGVRDDCEAALAKYGATAVEAAREAGFALGELEGTRQRAQAAEEALAVALRTVADHIRTGLDSPSTSAQMHARALLSEMDLAGCPIDAQVRALADGGTS